MPSQVALKKTMLEAAEAARKILLRHYGKLSSVGSKGGDPTNLVTIADKQAEAAIIGKISGAFPDHAFLGEESGASEGDKYEYRWVIDPLDGTTNYAHSLPIFSISIGLEYRGKMIMGLVVDVTRNEWFFAQKGGGAFLNGRRIHVSKAKRLAESLILTGFPHDRRRDIDHFMKILGGMLMRTQGVLRLGSAAIDLCQVACGRSEAFWEESLQPWDVAAGMLIVQEAGGRVTDLQGKRSKILDLDFVATNGLIHRELLATIDEFWEEWRA